MTESGRFVDVGDARLWLETSGAGEPLLFLNGGFGTLDMMGPMLKAFAQHFTVHAFEARGHGRSSRGRGPITYVREAVDATRVLDVLDLEDTHIFGHSDGGKAALHLLFDFPHRVRTATLSGTPYNQSCYRESARAFVRDFPRTLANGDADELGFRDFLLSQGMSPEAIQDLARGLQRGWASTPTFTEDMLGWIDKPVLVIEAGADQFIAVEHFRALTAAIPGAGGLDVPDMTHDPKPHAELIASKVAELASG